MRAEAGNPNRSLYDNNKEVYSLLRYGVQVQAAAGANRLGDWSERSNSNVEEALLTANLTRLADYIVSINGKLDWPRDHVLARLSSAG